jgi:hypothetical protein
VRFLRSPTPDARRVTWVSIVAVSLVTPIWLWTACDMWSGSFILDRYIPYEANFYDLQGRALLDGHLWLQQGSIGIEAFNHGGHQYTYFGLFPTLIRLPVLALTHGLDAHLTVPSMLIAWIVTAVSCPMLVWRVRCQLRGDAPLGRAELVSIGAFVATVCGGSVLIYLAATPFVFDEDLAWSVALSVASFFLLLGVLERPSGRRILWCGLVITAANLDRVTTGIGCALGALLLAGWFLLDRSGRQNRRFALPLALAGAIPLAIATALNFSKFGLLFGLPMQDQVFTLTNTYRRHFLAVEGGEVGIQFAPSNLLAYLRPDGLRFSTVFPFVTLPTTPAGIVGDVLFDRVYATTSVPASMPLLFLTACLGLFACLRRRPRSPAARGIALLVIASGVSAGAILLWGYIADRYLADFLPLLVVAGAVGLVELWRLMQGRGRRARRLAALVVTALALFGVVVNWTVSATPNDEWNPTQVANFVSTEASLASATGAGLADRVSHGAQLPAWAPAGSLFDVGDCEGLYISNGEYFSTVPLQSYEHATWMAVDEGAPFLHVLELRLTSALANAAERSRSGELTPLVRSGPSTVLAQIRAAGRPGRFKLRFVVRDPTYPAKSTTMTVAAGAMIQLTIVTDPQLHNLVLRASNRVYLDDVFTGGYEISLPTATPSADRADASAAVTDLTNPSAEDALCRRVAGS